MIARDGMIHGANRRGMGVMKIRTQKSRRQSRLPKPSEPSPRLSLQVALCAGGGAEPFTGKLQRISGTVIVTTRADWALFYSSAKWGVHINAIYAIYRLMHILHIKLHISAYFHCIFFAYLTNTVYIFAYFVHIYCIFLAYNCIFLAYNCI